jgi:anti-sigma-K factor RskA
MTANDAARDPASGPGDIEALLPWYAAGTLRRRDRQRVEAALQHDAALARHLERVREELAEAIHLNETLGAPRPHVAERLMAAIDAEASAQRKVPAGAAARWLTGFFANLPPRTLAVAASFAVLAIALQAFMLVDVFTKPQGETQQAALESGHRHGSFAMVRFAQAASAAEITNFLHNYQAALVDGPTQNGLYRVRIAVTALAKEEMSRIIARMRQDRVVELAEPAAEPAEPAELPEPTK